MPSFSIKYFGIYIEYIKQKECIFYRSYIIF